MALSRRGDYVMRAAIALARSFEVGAPRKIRELVAETAVPRTFASQILGDLVRTRIASSRAGRDGGYRLLRPPTEISALEVIEAAEGPLRAERCAVGEGTCRPEGACPLHERWMSAVGQLRDLLARTSLAELAGLGTRAQAALCVPPPDLYASPRQSVRVAEGAQVALAPDVLRSALVARSGRLGPLVGAAWRDGAGPYVGLRPARVASAPLTAACALWPAERQDGAQPADFSLAWRLSGPAGASRFEGTLTVLEAPGGARIQVSGDWHQDLDEGLSLTQARLEGLASAVVLGALRRLVRTLEASTSPTPWHGTSSAKATSSQAADLAVLP